MSLAFWDEAPAIERKRSAHRIVPPTPETGWRPDATFPDLSGAYALGFDLEVKENDFEHGPGWARGKSHIVGAAVSAFSRNGERRSWYYPCRHEVEPEFNIETERVIAYVRMQFGRNIPVFGANLLYDVGTAAAEGITITGELHDCQFAESLLNEAGAVNLEYLGLKYCGAGKETSAMYRWLIKAYGEKPEKQREDIYRCSPRLVGPYAEQDSALPFDVLQKQFPLMRNEGLSDLYRMECDLIRLWVQMRFAGVTIDVQRAERLYGEMSSKIAEFQSELQHLTGIFVDASTPGAQLQKVFDAAGIKYPHTAASKGHPEGQPSFVKEWLVVQPGHAAELIRAIREYDKIKTTFIKSYLLDNHVKGKIHGEFVPLRADDSGARTGRLSSRNPNLQNIPVRTKLGQEIRRCFLPDPGHLRWRDMDFSQYEYRILAHYAVGGGANELRAAYTANPNTDYHTAMQDAILRVTGKPMERKPVKTINFSLMNAMGQDELARRLNMVGPNGKPTKACLELFEMYHKGAPYIRATAQKCSDIAQRDGYITTLLGRRRRFDMWEPREKNWDNPAKMLPYELALNSYGPDIVRSMTHIALNSRLQGTNADGIKRALWIALKSGVFDVIGVPRITVHDSLGNSQIDNSPIVNQGYEFLTHTMETALPLNVPVRVDTAVGPTWGDVH